MIDFIKQNWSYICSGLFVLIALASVIVKLTPNTKDDGIVAKIIGVLDHLSIAKTKRDKELLEVAQDVLNGEKKEEKKEA